MEAKDFSSLSYSPNEAEPAIAPCPSADDGTSALSPEQQRLQLQMVPFFQIRSDSIGNI